MELFNQTEKLLYPAKYMAINNSVLVLQMILTISALSCLIKVSKLFGFRDPVMLISMICVTLSLILQMVSNVLSMAIYSKYFRSDESDLQLLNNLETTWIIV